MKSPSHFYLLLITVLLSQSTLGQNLKVYDKKGNCEKIIGEKSQIELIELKSETGDVRTEIAEELIFQTLNAGYNFVMKTIKENKLKYTSEFSAQKYFMPPYDFTKGLVLTRSVIYQDAHFTEAPIFTLHMSPVTQDSLNGLKLDSLHILKSIAKVHKRKPFNDYVIKMSISFLDKDKKLVTKELPVITIPLLQIEQSVPLNQTTIPIPAQTLASIQISIKEINAHQQKAAKNIEVLESNEAYLNNIFQSLLEKLDLKPKNND